MNLQQYLIDEGRVTGPLVKNTSHSGLEQVKKSILGYPQFVGGEVYLVFGTTLHSQFLIAGTQPTHEHHTVEEVRHLAAMLNKLRTHPIVCAFMVDSTREQKIFVKVDEVLMAMILDIEQKAKKVGADLKTTSCRSYEDFVEKAKEYGYFRQGHTYMVGAKLKKFYFIGIQKAPPYHIFILDVAGWPEELEYAAAELKFLLYFYKNYGKPIEEDPSR